MQHPNVVFTNFASPMLRRFTAVMLGVSLACMFMLTVRYIGTGEL